MNRLKGIRWFLVAIMASSTGFADLIIDNQAIPGAEIQSIVVSPTSGDVFVTTSTGYTVTPDDAPPPPPDAVVVSLSAAPTAIEVGQSTLLTWSSQNATTCSATGGTGDWANATAPLSGSKAITIAAVGTYTFILSCTGDAGTVQKQVNVTAAEPVIIDDNCDPSPLSGVTVDWADFWNGVPFPNPVYANVFKEIPRNGYFAIKFNTADFVDTGLLTTIESTSTPGRRLGSISQCPGDFDVADECRQIWGVGGEIFWSTEGYYRACKLQPNTNYYFNVTFTDGVDPASSECKSVYCFTKLRTNNPEG